MSTHNICFYEELTKIIFQLSPNTLLIYSTVNFFFTFLFNTSRKINMQTLVLSTNALMNNAHIIRRLRSSTSANTLQSLYNLLVTTQFWFNMARSWLPNGHLPILSL